MKACHLSDCGRGCYVIGGPWIDRDPDCPVHGTEARRREDDHNDLVTEVARLRALVEVRTARNPKTDPAKGDVIRWVNKGHAHVTLVTDVSPRLVNWVDLNENGYPDNESAHINEWRKHAGIQNGEVLFVAVKEVR